jgi:hypothetical protein
MSNRCSSKTTQSTQWSNARLSIPNSSSYPPTQSTSPRNLGFTITSAPITPTFRNSNLRPASHLAHTTIRPDTTIRKTPHGVHQNCLYGPAPKTTRSTRPPPPHSSGTAGSLFPQAATSTEHLSQSWSTTWRGQAGTHRSWARSPTTVSLKT